jgi:cell division protein FtsW
MKLFSREERPVDFWLVGTVGALLGLGTLMIYSTTAVYSTENFGSSLALVKRHILHLGLGVFTALICSRLNPSLLKQHSRLFAWIALILLIAVLIPGIGHEAGGARRWIVLGPMRFQPGEFSKVLLVLYFAGYIGRFHDIMGRFVLLLLAEPDFGSTVVVVAVVFCQLLTASRLTHLSLIGLVGAGSFVAAIASSPYRLRRLKAFLDPFADPNEAGYQLIQSLIAVGSGGLWGRGLGGGEQKLYYLPAAHTDFIFAMIAEELGLIGALVVLLLFLVIAVRGFMVVNRLKEAPFLSSLALGCTMLIVLPAMLNMGVVLGLLPTKGMVLPFVAYGGTGLLVYLSALGLLLNVSRLEGENGH